MNDPATKTCDSHAAAAAVEPNRQQTDINWVTDHVFTFPFPP